jgi:hypothetical protein
LLDELPSDDPGAVRSRRDLRRLNLVMGHAGIIQRCLGEWKGGSPGRILEIGAGDGTLMLRLARRLAGPWPRVTVILLDRQDLLSSGTKAEFKELGWAVECVQADLFDWLRTDASIAVDITLANLFLHHFRGEELREIFARLSARTHFFIGCEPWRSKVAQIGAGLVGLIGCNAITRHDARASVRAGFRDRELSELWPQPEGWKLREGRAGWCSHLFLAKRVMDQSKEL